MNIEIGRETNPEGFRAGNGTVGMAAAKCSAIGVPVLKHVVVRASADNTGETISVNSSSGTAVNGFILAAGEQTPPIYVNDVEKIWLIGSAADLAYSWMAN